MPYKGYKQNRSGRGYARGADHIRSIEIACKRYSYNALKILTDALDPAKTPELEYKMRMVAAKEILDRGYGKPKQSIDQNVEISVTGVTQALEAARQRALAYQAGNALENKMQEAVVAVVEQNEAEDAEFVEVAMTDDRKD